MKVLKGFGKKKVLEYLLQLIHQIASAADQLASKVSGDSLASRQKFLFSWMWPILPSLRITVVRFHMSQKSTKRAPQYLVVKQSQDRAHRDYHLVTVLCALYKRRWARRFYRDSTLARGTQDRVYLFVEDRGFHVEAIQWGSLNMDIDRFYPTVRDRIVVLSMK